jgi:hypothetical protein
MECPSLPLPGLECFLNIDFFSNRFLAQTCRRRKFETLSLPQIDSNILSIGNLDWDTEIIIPVETLSIARHPTRSFAQFA